jgi:predicted DCC family thiol-disulfide oxidoreductase YuxK
MDTYPSAIVDILYYDDQCGMCTNTVARWQTFFSKYNIKLASINSPEAKTRVNLPTNESAGEIKLFDSTKNKIHGGVDVFLYIAKKIWYLKPLTYLAQIPVIKKMLSYIYKRVANNRQAISKLFFN